MMRAALAALLVAALAACGGGEEDTAPACQPFVGPIAPGQTAPACPAEGS